MSFSKLAPLLCSMTLALSACLVDGVESKTKPLTVLDNGESWQPAINPSVSAMLKKTYEKGSDGKGVLTVEWNEVKGQKGAFDVDSYLYPPEFEKADVVLRCFIPANCSANELSLFLIAPASIPNRWNSKIGHKYTVKIEKSAQSAWRDIVIPLDMAEIMKRSEEPLPIAFNKIQVSYDKKDGTADYIKFGEVSLRRKDVFFDVVTNTNILVQDVSKPGVPGLSISNGSDSRKSVTVDYTIKDFERKQVDGGRKSLCLNAEESAVIPFKLPDLQGVYYIDFTIAHDNASFHYLKNIAKMKPTGRPEKLFSDGFLFSVCEHPMFYSASEEIRMLDYVEAMGANHVRWDGITWPSAQPTKDSPVKIEQAAWDSNERVISRNIEEMRFLMGFPAWANVGAPSRFGGPGKKSYMPEPAAWENWCRECAKAFKGRIRMFETWNEPEDKFNPEDYGKLQDIAYKGLKEGNPDAQLLAGGFGRLEHNAWHKKIMEDYSGSFDVNGLHAHGLLETDKTVLDKYLDMMRKAGVSKPWFAGETGFSAKTDTELMQSKALFQKLFYFWRCGSIGYIWYNLRNEGMDTKDGENWFGMLMPDCSPRPVYVTFNMITGLFRDAHYVGGLSLRPEISGFRFETKEHALFPMWTSLRDCSDQLIMVKTDAETLERFDIFGNKTDIPIEKGCAIVAANSLGCVYRLKPATAKMEYDGLLLDTTTRINIVSGGERTFKFTVRNSFAEDEKASVKLALPENLSCERTSFAASIPANGETEAEFKVKANQKFTSTKGNAPEIGVSVSVGGLSASTNYILPPASVVKAGGKEPALTFTINRPEQYARLIPALPEYGNCFWNGPQDNSAYIYIWPMGKNDKSLRFLIAVDDDVHSQKFSGHDMFQGDNLQLMLLLPGQKSYWEIGVSLRDDGKNEGWVWAAPEGVDKSKFVERMKIGTSYDQKHTLFYNVELPLDALGTTCEELRKNGFRMNLLVNDNDGKIRESHGSIIRGDTNTSKNPDNYPVVVFED